MSDRNDDQTMDDATADASAWAFGNGGFAKLYGERLAQSSLLDCTVTARWIFIFVLSQADSAGRYRCASIGCLARAAAVDTLAAEAALSELTAPDPNSTTKAEDGRRLILIPGGYQVVNYVKFREYRSIRQEKAAERKRRERERARAAERKRRERERKRVTPPVTLVTPPVTPPVTHLSQPVTLVSRSCHGVGPESGTVQVPDSVDVAHGQRDMSHLSHAVTYQTSDIRHQTTEVTDSPAQTDAGGKTRLFDDVTDNGNTNGNATLKPGEKAPKQRRSKSTTPAFPESWPSNAVGLALDMWKPYGAVAAGPLTGALKLIARDGWAWVDVAAGLARYLESGQARYGPAAFARGLGTLHAGRGGDGAGNGQAARESRARSVLERFVREGE